MSADNEGLKVVGYLDHYHGFLIKDMREKHAKELCFLTDAKSLIAQRDVRITELEAELQALKAERQWIPVGERLPKSDTEPVWCHGTYEGQYAPCGFEGIYRLSRWVCLNNSDYIDGGYGDDYEAVVTHWMPLPAAPQEDKSNG